MNKFFGAAAIAILMVACSGSDDSSVAGGPAEDAEAVSPFEKDTAMSSSSSGKGKFSDESVKLDYAGV